MVSLASPDYLITVSGFSGEQAKDMKTRRQLLKALRTEVGEVFLLSAFEPNPAGTGYHLHAWGYGDPLEDWQVTSAAEQVGLGTITDLKPVTFNGSFDYIVKNATWNQASLAEHIRLNGKELMQGRGFWRHARTGQHLNQEQARALVRDLDTAGQAPPSDAIKAANWSRKHLHAVAPTVADRVRDERPFTYLDATSGEVVVEMGARASLEALKRPGLVGNITMTFRDSEGRLRLLDVEHARTVPIVKVVA